MRKTSRGTTSQFLEGQIGRAELLAIVATKQTIVLAISPAPKSGRFLGYIDDDLIVTGRQPFLDGARALLARGYDPAAPYNMRHAHSDVLSFVTTTVGHAAGLSVNADRTRFQKFLPFEGIKEAAE
jgi:hypothetical protein